VRLCKERGEGKKVKKESLDKLKSRKGKGKTSASKTRKSSGTRAKKSTGTKRSTKSKGTSKKRSTRSKK